VKIRARRTDFFVHFSVNATKDNPLRTRGKMADFCAQVQHFTDSPTLVLTQLSPFC
jgi:hypothetical protein